MNAIRGGTWLAALLLVVVGSASAQAPAAPAAEPGARRARLSWTADRREFAVGDVLTVMIDEYALASANKTDVSQDLRRRDLDLGAGGSVAGSSLPGAAAGVSTTNDSDFRQRGDAVRQNRFQTEMTVQVIGLEAGGLLRIEGKKVIKLDKGEQQLTLSGVVRPEDISTSNLVDSWRIAEAELVYASKGPGSGGGILGRLLSAIWP